MILLDNGAAMEEIVRVPAARPFSHGRYLFRKRCMVLLHDRYKIPCKLTGVEVGLAAPADVDKVAAIDAAAFGDPVEQTRAWVEPHLGAPRFAVALARLHSEPVAVATAIVTDDQAGLCVGIFGVAVLQHARRQGIGTVLISWLLTRAFDQGALAHLNPHDETAARLYARLGFRETRGLDVYSDL